MKEIRRDPNRGALAPRRMVCFTTEGKVPVNEIQKDPKRQGLAMGKCFPLGKHEYLLKLKELEKMAENGDIRPAMDRITEMGIDTSDAAKFIASGISKQELHLEDVFPNIRTCPPKFLPNRARE